MNWKRWFREEDRFSFYNSKSWVKWKFVWWEFSDVDLFTFKLLFGNWREVKFIREGKELSNEEMKKTFFKDEKAIHNLFIKVDWKDKTKEFLQKYRSESFSIFKKEFIWYCFWFVSRWTNYSLWNYKLQDWKVESIQELDKKHKLKSDFKRLEKYFWEWFTSLIEQRDLIELDFMKQKTKEFSRITTKISQKDSVSSNSFLSMSFWNYWHSVVWIREENLLDTSNFSFSYNSDNKISLFYDWKCLSKSCELSEEKNKIKMLKRIYTYDNSYPDLNNSSIFLFTDYSWKEYAMTSTNSFWTEINWKKWLYITKVNLEFNKPDFFKNFNF